MSKLTPTCPHCGYEFDEEETWYSEFSEYGKVNTGDCDESDLVCPNLDCGKSFKVACVHVVTFEAIDD